MKRSILLLLLLVAQVVSTPAQGTAQLGASYLEERQYYSARNCFLLHLKTNQRDMLALLGLGDTYLLINEVDSARMAYQNMIAADPQNPFALIGMGKVALHTKDRESETTYFERARRTDKSNPEIYCAIAEGCIQSFRKDTVNALIYLRQGLDLHPKYARLHLTMGRLETMKRNYGAAINAFDRAIFFDPKSAFAYRESGLLQWQAHSYRDALHSLNKSIAVQPDQILGYKYLGDLFYSTGKYAEAESAYQTYLERADVTTEDEERFAITLFFNKKYKEAETLLERVMADSGDETVLLRIRGYIAFETGDIQNGLSAMNRFFQLHDKEKFIASDYGYYAKLFLKAGEESKAMENFRKALVLEPTNTSYLEELAKLASRNRLHPEAAFCYNQLMKLGADKSVNNFLVGKEYYFEGELWRTRHDSLKNQQKKSKIPFNDSTTVKNGMIHYYQLADSAFEAVCKLNATYAGGYIWKGRIQSILDPEAKSTAAKENYQKALELLEKGDAAKNQKSIIECYKYLGSYYFLGYERYYQSDKKLSGEMRNQCIEYFSKIKNLDPTDVQAIEVLKKMNK